MKVRMKVKLICWKQTHTAMREGMLLSIENVELNCIQGMTVGAETKRVWC